MFNNISRQMKEMQGTYKIDSYNHFRTHNLQMKEEYETRLNIEQNICNSVKGSPFTLKGFCCICNREASFYVDFKYSSNSNDETAPVPNWRERLLCEFCKMNNRMRAALHVFCTQMNGNNSSSIYITEALTSTYRWLKQKYPNTIGSEYWGDNLSGGTVINGIRHENMMNLSFEDNSFDTILSFDVLEHVPDPDKAFREVYRTLKDNGYLLWTAPFDVNAEQDIIRAELLDDGNIHHILPPEIHGNPTDPENGALCFRYFSWDVLQRLYNIGFKDAYCLAYWSLEHGYLGQELYIFIAQK